MRAAKASPRSPLTSIARTTLWPPPSRGAQSTSIPKRVCEKPVRTDGLIETINTVIEEKEGKATVSGFECQFAVLKRTMGRLVKADLGLNVYMRTLRQALSTPDMGKRLERAKILLSVIKKKLADM